MKNRPHRQPLPVAPWSFSDPDGLDDRPAVDLDESGQIDGEADLWEAFAPEDAWEEPQPEYGDFWMEEDQD